MRKALHIAIIIACGAAGAVTVLMAYNRGYEKGYDEGWDYGALQTEAGLANRVDCYDPECLIETLEAGKTVLESF